MPFRDLNGMTSPLGLFLAEELTTQLIEQSNGVRVIERSQLDQILVELKLNSSGVIDPTTARQIGKVAGADALVTGTITDLTSTIAVNCRLVDSETGAVFAAAQARIVKDEDIKRVMEQPAIFTPRTESTAGASTGNGSGKLATRNTSTSARPRGAADGFLFELQECVNSAGGILCEFLITNEREQFALRLDNDTRFFDTSGRQFAASRLAIGNQETFKFGQGVTMVPRLPTRATIAFENVGEAISRIPLLEVKGFARTWYTVQFRNIDVPQAGATNSDAPRPSVSNVSANSSGLPSSVAIAKSFKNDFLLVTVDLASVSPDGKRASVALTFQNQGSEEEYLATSCCPGASLTDRQANQWVFDYNRSAGLPYLISQQDIPGMTRLAPQSSHTVVLQFDLINGGTNRVRPGAVSFSMPVFRRRGERVQTFSVGISNITVAE